MLVAVKVQDYKPPTWPDPAVPKQMHLHLKVDDLDAAQTDAVRLGARVATERPIRSCGEFFSTRRVTRSAWQQKSSTDTAKFAET